MTSSEIQNRKDSPQCCHGLGVGCWVLKAELEARRRPETSESWHCPGVRDSGSCLLSALRMIISAVTGLTPAVEFSCHLGPLWLSRACSSCRVVSQKTYVISLGSLAAMEPPELKRRGATWRISWSRNSYIYVFTYIQLVSIRNNTH